MGLHLTARGVGLAGDLFGQRLGFESLALCGGFFSAISP
jgi:hypothetical protein